MGVPGRGLRATAEAVLVAVWAPALPEQHEHRTGGPLRAFLQVPFRSTLLILLPGSSTTVAQCGINTDGESVLEHLS